jgi:hypothetical protein
MAEVDVDGRQRIGMKRWLVLGICGIFLLGSVGSARAEESFWREAGLGVGAGFATVLYVPAKAVYALLGVATGGIAYCVTGGDVEVANEIWNASINGTWVLTPPMLDGAEKIHFNAPPRRMTSSLREFDAPATVDNTQTGDSGYGTPAPRYEEPAAGAGGSGWN